MEVGAILSLNSLEAIRDAFDGWHLGVFGLGQTCHTGVATLGAAQYFIPLIDHRRRPFWASSMTASRIAGCSKLLTFKLRGETGQCSTVRLS
jgi:hypothetical protein